MREIKFRAWNKEEERMLGWNKEIKGVTVGGIKTVASYNTGYGWSDIYNLNEVILMQYTGLKDKNGKEIYEGDICRWRDLETFNDEILEDIFVVVWNDEKLAWYTQNEDGNFGYDLYEYTDDRDLGVIGNIYENIDLLEVEL